MKLFFNRPSPYARKVLVLLHEKGLAGAVELHPVDPWRDPPELLAATPLSKVPALVTAEGLSITESWAICQHLDAVGKGAPLAGTAPDLLSRAGLAQGLMDAAFQIVLEGRRPAEARWPDWIGRQRRAIARAVPLASPAAERFDLGDITLACALAYMDFRLSDIPWRSWSPQLAGWLDDVARRPSMQATDPEAP
jgi:glutathione S-transferase